MIKRAEMIAQGEPQSERGFVFRNHRESRFETLCEPHTVRLMISWIASAAVCHKFQPRMFKFKFKSTETKATT